MTDDHEIQSGQEQGDDVGESRDWQRIPRHEQDNRAEGWTGKVEDRDVARGRYNPAGDISRDEILRYAIVYCARILIWALVAMAIIVLFALVVAAVAVIWTAVSPDHLAIVPDDKMERIVVLTGSLVPHISFVTGSTVALVVVGFVRWWSRHGN